MELERKLSVGSGVGLVVGSWLVPGLGFVLRRNYWRGAAVFLILNGTFLLGLLLHGTVLVPEFRYYSPAFNIVNLLTFIGQLGNAGASLFCLAHDRLQWDILRADETHPWFDLAALYLLVSGCMNYFCVGSFYDRYLAAGKTQGEERAGGEQ
ncbi:MAG: hypothetical protein AMJ84_05305 [Acidithiobacillales bacterium SM23_46]|nr:MAG: hypothetical protein AMJ84_05305 [Acidithiobacillales bacterium SM23_46]KPL25642.1 MAG: hypothetical protein AMJ72_13585 [Acidithiobacillales bacterium SM1_46]